MSTPGRARTRTLNRRLRLPATEVLSQSLGNPRHHPVVRVVEVADGVPGADELIKAGAVLIGESHLEHLKGVLELFHGARTDDRRGDAGLVLTPEKRKLALRQITPAAPAARARGQPRRRAVTHAARMGFRPRCGPAVSLRARTQSRCNGPPRFRRPTATKAAAPYRVFAPEEQVRSQCDGRAGCRAAARRCSARCPTAR